MQSHTSVLNGGCAENGTLPLKEGPTTSKANAVANGDCTETDLNTKNNASAISNLSDSDKEVIRLVGQHLCALGLQKSSEALMSESGCRLEHAVATKFRECIMQGQWNKVEATLPEVKPLLKNQRYLQKLQFFVMEQKFLELIEDGKMVDALFCLRNQITPLRLFPSRVHQLSSFLMMTNPQDLQKAANWDGKGPKSRSKLLDKLQSYLPISIMMRPNRLKTLLTQALQYQQSKCLCHNSSKLPTLTSFSLLTDHTCLRRNFPVVSQQTLTEHTDEVLCCQFSNKGKMLATGSKDTKVIIWNVDSVTRTISHARTLSGHAFGVGYLSWSPNDEHLLACGVEDSPELYLWNAMTGELNNKINNTSEDSITSCCWMTDGKRYVAGGGKGQFYQYDFEGNVIESWEGVRVQSLCALPDNKTVLAADNQHRVRAYNFDDMTDYNIIKEDHSVMSISLSGDGRLVLLNVATQGVHLWDVEDQILIRKFQGVVHGFFMIFSCFGGPSDEYIASGSEDHKVYIWHRSQEKPLETLVGHSKTVNSVSWNKACPSMLASASDDGTVRIWGPPESSSSDSDDDIFPQEDY